MRNVICQLAVSLDMFIARKDGSVDFLDQIGDEFNEDFMQFQAGIDSIVMGRGTYEKMLEYGEIPFKDKKIFVLTSKDLVSEEQHITFTDKPIKKLIEELSGTIWLFGGAKIINACRKEQLIDEMQLFIVPVIVLEGIPLFTDAIENEMWRLSSLKQYGNNAYLTYKRKEK